MQKTELLSRYGNAVQFLQKFSPAQQREICIDAEDCVRGDYPTLGRLKWYGKTFAGTWLMAQLTELSEYCGCKDKMPIQVIEQCADLIVMRYNYLKVSEFMLFFARFKLGDYGKFYGAVDPLVITTALRSFIRDRDILLDKINSKKIDLQIAEDKKNAITYEEYLRRKEGRK